METEEEGKVRKEIVEKLIVVMNKARKERQGHHRELGDILDTIFHTYAVNEKILGSLVQEFINCGSKKEIMDSLQHDPDEILPKDIKVKLEW